MPNLSQNACVCTCLANKTDSDSNIMIHMKKDSRYCCVPQTRTMTHPAMSDSLAVSSLTLVKIEQNDLLGYYYYITF